MLDTARLLSRQLQLQTSALSMLPDCSEVDFLFEICDLCPW